jgi:hypothetical protein
MTTADRGLPTQAAVRAFTTTGYHPRDGRPVACWVIHPTAIRVRTPRLLDDLASRLRLTAPGAISFAETSTNGPWTTWDGQRAVLRAVDGSELHAEHDPEWSTALVDRGWAVVVLACSCELTIRSNREIQDYLASGGRTRVGITHLL